MSFDIIYSTARDTCAYFCINIYRSIGIHYIFFDWKFQTDPFNYHVRGRPTGLLPFILASKVCLESCFQKYSTPVAETSTLRFLDVKKK